MKKSPLVTIAWDVDDVLNDLICQWFETTWKTKHPECKLVFEDLSENPPHHILDISKEQYLESLDSFRFDPSYDGITPLLPVKEWFIDYGHEFRHVALTAVPFFSAGNSAKWVLSHYGQWIRMFNFIPSYRPTCNIPVYDKTKQEFLNWIQQIDYLVDDNEENIQEAEFVGVEGILFPRPWNSNRDKSVEKVLTLLSSHKEIQTKKQ